MFSSKCVVTPTCKRPEMLALALEALDRTNTDADVRIFADTDTNVNEVEYVRDNYYPKALIFHAKPHIYLPSGMWNILHALKSGYETGSSYVFIIEEDVVIRPGYFDWHMAAQASGNFLATCGRRMKRYPNFDRYTNPGSCFRRDKLALVVKHINNEFFSDYEAYQDRVFGPMEESSKLDDGLIRRVARQYGLEVKYPDIDDPKCAHIGFRLYNKVDIFQNQGNIQERIEGLRKMLPTIDSNGRYSKDFEPLYQ